MIPSDPITPLESSEIAVTDRRAHERIDILDIHSKVQQGLIEKQSETLNGMRQSLDNIAKNVESFTTIFQTLKGIRAFIVWSSPVCLALLALWSMAGDIIHKVKVIL